MNNDNLQPKNIGKLIRIKDDYLKLYDDFAKNEVITDFITYIIENYLGEE